MLNGEDHSYQLFALEQILKRNNYEPETVETVVAAIENKPQLIMTELQYLEAAPTCIFQSSIKHLLITPRLKVHVNCLDAIL